MHLRSEYNDVIPAKAGIQTMNNEKTIPGLALDIDDTLSWTCREWVDTIHAEFGNPENLTKYEFAEKYHLLKNAPYIQRADIIARIREMCVDVKHHEFVPLIEGAPEAIKQIVQHIPIVMYLTARPESMRRATVDWLARHGFPELELVMRPEHIPIGEPAALWKACTLEELYPRVIGIIDDNPSICSHLSTGYQGAVFLYRNNQEDTIPHSCAVHCGEWSDVVEKVLGYYKTQESYDFSHDF